MTRAAPSNPGKQRRSLSAHVGIAGAAEYLDVEHKLVRGLIASGELPAYRVGRRLIKIKISDLEALLVPMKSDVPLSPPTSGQRPRNSPAKTARPPANGKA